MVMATATQRTSTLEENLVKIGQRKDVRGILFGSGGARYRFIDRKIVSAYCLGIPTCLFTYLGTHLIFKTESVCFLFPETSHGFQQIFTKFSASLHPKDGHGRGILFIISLTHTHTHTV